MMGRDTLSTESYQAGKQDIKRHRRGRKAQLGHAVRPRHSPFPAATKRQPPKKEVMIAISGKIAVANRLIAGDAQFISYATDKKGASDQKKKCRASRSCCGRFPNKKNQFFFFLSKRLALRRR